MPRQKERGSVRDVAPATGVRRIVELEGCVVVERLSRKVELVVHRGFLAWRSERLDDDCACAATELLLADVTISESACGRSGGRLQRTGRGETLLSMVGV